MSPDLHLSHETSQETLRDLHQSTKSAKHVPSIRPLHDVFPRSPCTTFTLALMDAGACQLHRKACRQDL